MALERNRFFRRLLFQEIEKDMHDQVFGPRGNSSRLVFRPERIVILLLCIAMLYLFFR